MEGVNRKYCRADFYCLDYGGVLLNVTLGVAGGLCHRVNMGSNTVYQMGGLVAMVLPPMAETLKLLDSMPIPIAQQRGILRCSVATEIFFSSFVRNAVLGVTSFIAATNYDALLDSHRWSTPGGVALGLTGLVVGYFEWRKNRVKSFLERV